MARAVSAFFTGNREYANLPRKFKIAVTGCGEDCARVEINDIGLWPARAGRRDARLQRPRRRRAVRRRAHGVGHRSLHPSRPGGRALPGRGPGLRRAGQPGEPRPGQDALPGPGARTRRFPRGTRRAHLGFDLRAGRAASSPHDSAATTSVSMRRSSPACVYVGCSVPVGRMHGIELVELARLADTYGDGDVRIGTDQNFVVSGVPEDRLEDLLAEPLMQQYSPFPGPFERGVVACTGSEFCRFAIVETKERAVKWARELDERFPAGDRRRTRASSACTSRVAPRPARSPRSRTSGSAVTSRTWTSTSRKRSTSASVARSAPMPPSSTGSPARCRSTRSPKALARLVGRYLDEHRAGEPFHSWARRDGPARVAEHTCRSERDGRAVKGFRIREEMNGIDEPPGKVWFWELEAGVIHAERCIECGTCVAVCPSNSIGVNEDTGLPELVKMCTGLLPVLGLLPPRRPALRGALATIDRECRGGGRRRAGAGAERLVRHLLEDQRRPPRRRIWARWSTRSPCAPQRSSTDAQDGGAVSALLIGLLAAGEIDGALVSKPSPDPDEQWKGVATIATTAEEVRASAGSFYNQTMALAELDLSKYALPAEAAPRGRRHTLRGPGSARHAGATLADRGAPGRRGRAHDRTHVHEELRLRGAHAPGAARQARRRPRPGLEDGRDQGTHDRRVPGRADARSTSR